MSAQFGSVNCMCQRKVYEWVARFRSEKTSVTKLDRGTRQRCALKATSIVLSFSFEKTGLLCLTLLLCHTSALVLPVLLLCPSDFVCV
jgi:hypothetical protein